MGLSSLFPLYIKYITSGATDVKPNFLFHIIISPNNI